MDFDELQELKYGKKTSLKQLRQGERIYSVINNNVIIYEYLCIHPKEKSEYHILIDIETDEPIKIHNTELGTILSFRCRTLREAQLDLAETLENRANYLRVMNK